MHFKEVIFQGHPARWSQTWVPVARKPVLSTNHWLESPQVFVNHPREWLRSPYFTGRSEGSESINQAAQDLWYLRPRCKQQRWKKNENLLLGRWSNSQKPRLLEGPNGAHRPKGNAGAVSLPCVCFSLCFSSPSSFCHRRPSCCFLGVSA